MKKPSAIFMQEVTEVFQDLEHTLIAYEKKEGDAQLESKLCELWHSVRVLLTVSGLAGLAGLAGQVLAVFEKHRNERRMLTEEVIDLALASLGFLHTSLLAMLTDSLMPGPQAEAGSKPELDRFSVKWSTFLPASRHQPQTDTETDNRPRVLIVDDEVINRMLLEETVRKTSPDINIVSVGSAEEGLYHYFTGGFDLVFLDIMMPNIDGNHFISIVQKNRDAGHLKFPPNIVVQTAVDSMEQLVSYAKRECIQEVIRKPLPFDRVRECVERYCLRR